MKKTEENIEHSQTAIAGSNGTINILEENIFYSQYLWFHRILANIDAKQCHISEPENSCGWNGKDSTDLSFTTSPSSSNNINSACNTLKSMDTQHYMHILFSIQYDNQE